MLAQLYTYSRWPLVKRLDETLADRRYSALRRLVRIWDTQRQDPSKWYPLNAKMVFRNGYHERLHNSAWEARMALMKRRWDKEGNGR